jgi:hypothetical protein
VETSTEPANSGSPIGASRIFEAELGLYISPAQITCVVASSLVLLASLVSRSHPRRSFRNAIEDSVRDLFLAWTEVPTDPGHPPLTCLVPSGEH